MPLVGVGRSNDHSGSNVCATAARSELVATFDGPNKGSSSYTKSPCNAGQNTTSTAVAKSVPSSQVAFREGEFVRIGAGTVRIGPTT